MKYSSKFAIQIRCMANVTQITNPEAFRKRKSVALSKDQWNSLKKYRKGFNTEVECALSIGLDRNVLNNIILKGSGSPESIEKIIGVVGQ